MSYKYVTMKDTFLSGWGKAKGKANILVFHCDNDEDVEAVLSNAGVRDEMENLVVRITPLKGRQNCYVQQKTKEDYPNWYKKNYFKKENLKREAEKLGMKVEEV